MGDRHLLIAWSRPPATRRPRPRPMAKPTWWSSRSCPPNPPDARPAIRGERVCFLVLVDDRDLDDGELTFAATGDGVTIDRVGR